MNYFHDYLREKHTNYPYFNTGNGMFTQFFSPIKKAIAFINPFREQGIPSVERSAMFIRDRNSFYMPDPYPEKSVIKGFFPTHYDPASDSSVTELNPNSEGLKSPYTNGTLEIDFEEMPKACQREFFKYNRCKMINGKDKCEAEKINTLEICPDFALSGKKNIMKQVKKINLILLKDYRESLKIPKYNLGKSLKDVDYNKDSSFGNKENLRPNSLWNDERYTKVTLEEIEAAKKRLMEKGKLKNDELKKPFVPSEVYANYPEPSSVYLNK